MRQGSDGVTVDRWWRQEASQGKGMSEQDEVEHQAACRQGRRYDSPKDENDAM